MAHSPRLSRSAAFASACALAVLVGLAAAGVATAAKGDCGQPVSTDSGPNASDCSAVLKASVGSAVCAECICDINGSASLTTTDALLCLKKAVGQNVALKCPPCNDVTTTTLPDIGGGPSTTSTSTTSTTTTLPVRCSSESDCDDLPSAFRCNPNTDTCEKPCTRNTDCKDFYECNKVTGYCQEPAAQL